MKLIEAFIPPDAVYEVQELLSERGLDDFVVSEVAVEAGNDGPAWSSARPDYVPQAKLEMVVTDEQATPTAHQIFAVVSRRCAEGSAQILIARLEEVVWIESGEHGFRKFIDALKPV